MIEKSTLDNPYTRDYLGVMELYHADIRLPEGYRKPIRRVKLAWTDHALKARHNDRYGVIPHFDNIPLSRFETVEVGMDRGHVVKIVMRGHYSATLDVVFVLIPVASGPWTVKTVWYNERNDSHRTLDRTKYVR